MVQDRSFDALAYTTGFSQGTTKMRDLTPADFQAQEWPSAHSEERFQTAGGRIQLRCVPL
jgi:hypothetical protein